MASFGFGPGEKNQRTILRPTDSPSTAQLFPWRMQHATSSKQYVLAQLSLPRPAPDGIFPSHHTTETLQASMRRYHHPAPTWISEVTPTDRNHATDGLASPEDTIHTTKSQGKIKRYMRARWPWKQSRTPCAAHTEQQLGNMFTCAAAGVRMRTRHKRRCTVTTRQLTAKEKRCLVPTSAKEMVHCRGIDKNAKPEPGQAPKSGPRLWSRRKRPRRSRRPRGHKRATKERDPRRRWTSAEPPRTTKTTLPKRCSFSW